MAETKTELPRRSAAGADRKRVPSADEVRAVVVARATTAPQGPTGPAGPRGDKGPTGPAGSVGSFLAGQPKPAELLKDLARTATTVSPRMLVDPRESVGYVRRVAKGFLKLQGSLLVRALFVSDDHDELEATQEFGRLRSIA